VLLIDLRGKKICAILDRSHPNYKDTYILVRSLLGSNELSPDVWFIGYNGLVVLRNRLDRYGLVEGRTMTTEAKGLVDWVAAKHIKNDNIKDGRHNEYIQGLLEGKLKSIPYADQLTGVAFAVENRRCGIFDKMGSGKSLESLASLVAVRSRKSLVILPKNVILDFVKEIKKHTYLKHLVLPPGRKTALEFLKKHKDDDYDIMIVHSENLIGSSKRETYGQITKVLKSMLWDVIVVDEFHRYKNLDAKRTKCVLRILSDSKDYKGEVSRCLLLTGTPVSESPLNAYAVLRVLSYVPHISRFKHYFCIEQEVSHGSGTHKEIIGYKNLDELKSWLEQVSIRRTDLKGFPEKPPPIEKTIRLYGKHLEQYNVILEEAVKDVKSLSPRDIFDLRKWMGSAKAIRLRQILNHPGILNVAGDSCKYKELDEILDEILADKESKVVLWTEFRPAVDLLYERYNQKYGVLKMYGGVDATEEMVQTFEHKERPRIVAAIPAKAGTGTDWLARARTFIYLDRPYSYILYQQSLDRGHRRIPVGELSWLDKIRSSPLTIMFLEAENSVDRLVRDKLLKTGDMVDAVTIKTEKLVEMGRDDLLRYLR